MSSPSKTFLASATKLAQLIVANDWPSGYQKCLLAGYIFRPLNDPLKMAITVEQHLLRE